MRIDQYLPDFAPHDAIGNHVLQVRKVLRQAGFDSDIYADIIHAPLAGEARHYRQAPPPGEGIAIYQASTYSDIAGWLASRARQGEKLLGYYHNITPAEYFARWEPVAAEGCERARSELADLAPHTDLAMAASAYNEAELIDAGYKHTVTSPLLVDLDAYHAPPAQRTLQRLRGQREGEGSRWLFVGRLAPNKCQHDVIGAFAVYTKAFDPHARLVLAGSPASARYLRALEALASELGVADKVDFTGSVPFGDLLAQFAVADVFVCCSEHEGFCVPVIEAMELGVPVVAYAAAAIPETVGDAGVVLDDKDPLTVAVAVAALNADEHRRESLTAAGRRRAADFSLPSTSSQFLGHIQHYLAGI